MMKRAAGVCQARALAGLRQRANFHQSTVSASSTIQHLGGSLCDREEEENTRTKILPSRRDYHTTHAPERAPAIIMGLATVSALGFAGSSAIKSYNEWKASQPTEEELQEIRKQEEQERAQQKAQQEAKEKEEESKPRKNIFREWFDVGTKYYEGGFEETMTKREAALILGVRESSSPARIKDAHRKLLILNHPDTGGSTYIAGKVNEAKELLLKGKSTRK